MIITNLIIENPTAFANSRIAWDFNFINRNSIPDSTVRFKLGFLSTPKMLTNLDCKILELQTYTQYSPEGVSLGAVTNYAPSSSFGTIVFNSLLNAIDVTMRGVYAPPAINPFRIECFGFKAPSGESTTDLSV